MKPLVIGSRSSPLALQQSKTIKQALLRHHPGLGVNIEIIHTSGDALSQTTMSRTTANVKGLFVKEIEEALLQNKIDIAVHSLKDLPTELPAGLDLALIPEREDPRDVLIASSSKIQNIDDLKEGAKLGTGSLRRQVQLKHLRSDLVVTPIQGNIDTRIRKIQEQNLTGIILAAAGLRRLGLEKNISYVFNIDEMVPAVGQGALAVEIRSGDNTTRTLVAPLDHALTHTCALAERQFLSAMGGGCQMPLGAHAHIADGLATFVVFVGDPFTQKILSKTSHGHPKELKTMALDSAEFLLSHGANEILERVKNHFQE